MVLNGGPPVANTRIDVKVRLYSLHPTTRDLYFTGAEQMPAVLNLGEPQFVLEKRKRVQVQQLLTKDGKETTRYIKTEEKDSEFNQELQRSHIRRGRLRTAS